MLGRSFFSYKANDGFTIIELVIVMVIIGVLSSISVSRTFSGKTFELKGAKDDVLNIISSAQHLAMSRGSNEEIVLIFNQHNLDLQINGKSLEKGPLKFPFALPKNIQISSVPVNHITFNVLGDTYPIVITLIEGSSTANIKVSESGYAY